MRIGYYVNGSIRRVNQKGEKYDYISHHQLLAKKINADLILSSWKNNTDTSALSTEEVINLDGDILLLNNPLDYPDLYWQHVGFCNLVGKNSEEKYDIIIRARWDNIYTEKSIEHIYQAVTDAHLHGVVSGFVSNNYKALSHEKQLNDHLIVTRANNFNYEYSMNFLQFARSAWKLIDDVRLCSNQITKAEHIWWWLICSRYNLKCSNYHL